MEAVGAGSSDTVSSGDIITGAIIILVAGTMQGKPTSSPTLDNPPPRIFFLC